MSVMLEPRFIHKAREYSMLSEILSTERRATLTLLSIVCATTFAGRVNAESPWGLTIGDVMHAESTIVETHTLYSRVNDGVNRTEYKYTITAVLSAVWTVKSIDEKAVQIGSAIEHVKYTLSTPHKTVVFDSKVDSRIDGALWTTLSPLLRAIDGAQFAITLPLKGKESPTLQVPKKVKTALRAHKQNFESSALPSSDEQLRALIYGHIHVIPSKIEDRGEYRIKLKAEEEGGDVELEYRIKCDDREAGRYDVRGSIKGTGFSPDKGERGLTYTFNGAEGEISAVLQGANKRLLEHNHVLSVDITAEVDGVATRGITKTEHTIKLSPKK